MMGMFVSVEIDDKKCLGLEEGGECIRICPVNIFEAKAGRGVLKEEKEDERTLCTLCMDKCQPCAISIKKLYE